MGQTGGAGNSNGGTNSGPLKIKGSYLDFDEISTPANPAANDGRLYVKDDATVTKLYFRDSAGTETDLLAGGGGGDVTGPASSIDNRLVTFSGTGGKTIQDASTIALTNAGTDNVFTSIHAISFTSTSTDADALDFNANSGGVQFNVADTTPDSFAVNTNGGFDLNASGRFQVISTQSAADAIRFNASTGGMDIDAAGDFNATLTGLTSEFVFTTASSAPTAFDLNATAGGFDLDTVGAISLTSTSTSSFTTLTLQQDNNAAVVGGGIDILARQTSAGGTGGNINIATSATAGSPGSIDINTAATGTAALNIDSSGGIDIDAAQLISIQSTRGAADAIELLSTDGNINVKATSSTGPRTLTIQTDVTTGSAGGDLTIQTDSNHASGTGGDLILQTLSTLGTGGNIVLNADGTTASSIDINSAAGGIDVDAAGIIDIATTSADNNAIALRSTAGGVAITCTQDFSIYEETATASQVLSIQQYHTSANLAGGLLINSTVANASGTGGDITISTVSSSGTAGGIIINSADTATDGIDIDSSGGIDVDAAGIVNITTTSTNAAAISLNATTGAGGISLNAGTSGINLNDDSLVSMGWARIATATSTNTTTEVIVGVTDNTVARTITLASADAVAGRIIIVKDEAGTAASANNITIATQGAENIDGSATATITANYGVIRLYSDGNNWYTF